MENLIKNSCWLPGPTGGPKYFSGVGPITYDDFSLDGYRTCSITMAKDSKLSVAIDSYDIPICVSGQNHIVWGYCIRKIDADSIKLVANFYDENNCLINTEKKDITKKVCYEFMSVVDCFAIPCNAYTVKLSLEFEGKITACTYFAPTAYFC